MTDAGLSTNVVAFLRRYVQSIRKLDTLLPLYTDRDKSWSVDAVSLAVSCHRKAVSLWLEELRASGFVTVNGSSGEYQFCSSPHDETIGMLAKDYKMRPAKVIDAIVNRSTHTMMGFMNAFNLGDGRDNGDQ